MTRQPLGDRAARRLLLDVRELARDGAEGTGAGSEDVQTVLAAFGAQRVAVLQYVMKATTNLRDPDVDGKNSNVGVRLGVFKNAHDADSVTVPSNQWTSLWTKEETEAVRTHREGRVTTPAQGEERDNDNEDEEFKWSLAWSPDGKYLVVGGFVMNIQTKTLEARLWVVSSRDWMAIEDAAQRPTTSSSSLLLSLRVDPAKHLSAKEFAKSSQLVTLFFLKNKSNRLFFVTNDGVLVKIDVPVPKLALLTLNNNTSEPSASDKKTLFQMKVVKRMSEWHAGVSAATFEATSATLVVAGGLKNPSDGLVQGRASSLSVWKMLETEPFCDLLDYTIVLSEEQQSGDGDGDGDADSAAAAAGEQSSSGEANQLAQNTPSSGLLQSVKGSLFSPLKFIIGGNATSSTSSVLRGSIRQLALSPNGVYVTMLDVHGRFSIRQIDTCSDVVGWQFVDSALLSSSSSSRRVSVAELLEQVGSLAAVKTLTWVSSTMLAFVLKNCRVVYGELKRESDEDEGMLNEEIQDSVQASSLGRIEIVSVHSHLHSFSGVLEKDVRVDAIAPIPSTEDESGGDAVRGYQLLAVNGVSTVTSFENVELAAFVDLLMKSHQYDRALDVVQAHGMTGVVNLDAIHRQIWSQFRTLATIETMESNQWSLLATECVDPGVGFNKAMHHLSLIQDKKWVVDQCLHVVALNSFAHMKEILVAGLFALMSINEDNSDDAKQDESVAVSQRKILRFIYRLDTLKLLLAEELVETDELLATHDDVDPNRLAKEKYYDGAAFAQFRSASIAEVAKQLACEGRVGSLNVLFQRNAWTLIPRRLEVLSLLPASILPVAYAHLLPAVGPDSRNEWQFYTLPRSEASAQEELEGVENLDSSRHLAVMEVELNPENKSHDLEADDLALFEFKARQSGQERREEYANWFRVRILEMDSLFGQLANAFYLSSLAKECLHGWQKGEPRKNEFEAFQRDVERLYNCIYPLQLSSCCLLSLEEWSALPLHDQILCVIGSDWDSVIDAIDRIQAVFVAQRGGDALCMLDDAFSSLCQTLSRKSSLPALELCAQLIHHSNPSMPVVERWIQDDARLLRIAIDVVCSATTSGYFRNVEELNAQHGTFVEQLWTIFQSLPIRKEDDLPEIEQLQVEVDEMEDLMVTMDVLNKYGVHTSPTELKMQIGEASTTAAEDLLQRMCRFSLPGKTAELRTDGASEDEAQWMEVWRDATKLKTHVFGERISQEAILDVILRHLLSHDVYLDAAEHLVSNWTDSNYEVVHHVIVVLLRAIQAKMDTLKGNFVLESDLKAHLTALKCIDIVKRVLLASPLLESEPDRKKHYERQLHHETELVHACQLLDLLTYGAVKLSPAAIRPLKDAKDRLEVVLKVFTSNPSHYQPSNRAREWFKQHNLEHVLSLDNGASPLEAVLYLAKLLRVDDHKHQIVMKGAYAALYCADYDVAYGLTTEVIESIRVAVEPQHDGEKSHHGRSDDMELQHLMSLVLDLISASSFRSWFKKLKLCRLVFSAQNISSTSLFSHQITNLIMAAMEKLEAVEAVATELGLSEADVEERRHLDVNRKRSSVEELLLKELEIVVDLLQEEKNDRGFLLRLLQKGFQLVNIVFTAAITQQSDDDDSQQHVESAAAAADAVVLQETQRAERMAQQMSRICFEAAIASAFESTSEARTLLEMGLSYLLLWSDFSPDDRCDLKFFWEQEIFPLLSSAAAASSSSSAGGHGIDELVRHCHHFFMLQVASALQGNAVEDVDMSVAQELQARRKCLDTFIDSYEETKRYVVSKSFEPEAEGDDELADADENHANGTHKSVFSKTKRDVFARLANRCQDMMLSQKKTQELEEMNSFFNENLDLERFSRDSEYRVSKILMLATTKEHYQVAKQFATKYGVDEYQCLLSYIKSAFLPTKSSASSLDRHEQLEIAFRSENEDFLEHALEKPFVFGDFLLNNSDDNVYELLHGTDHVGILLLLRMVLECSKRIAQLSQDGAMDQSAVDTGSLFPLSKESSDRITLLFMCLKRLKEFEPVKRGPRMEVVDFKLVCAAESCSDLLYASTSTSSDATDSRKLAVEALLPFLNGKTIKMLTKILQKLHHVTTSAVVMVYLSDMLHNIWLEHQAGGGNGGSSALAGDLAAYAYEACTPFLSVLANEHVMLFHSLFLGRNWDYDTEEFYGQSMDGITHFGVFLTPQKRLELISDTQTLFQIRFKAWKTANGTQQVDDEVLAVKENELRLLESELVEAAFWFIAHEVKTNGILFPGVFQGDWEHLEALMTSWFNIETGQKKHRKQELRGLLILLCQQVSSVEIASLMVELVLHVSSLEDEEVVAATLEEVYRRVFKSGVDGTLSSERSEELQRAIVSEWVTSFPDSHSKISEQLEGAAEFISALCSRSTTDQSANTTIKRGYQRIVSQLDQFPCLALKHIIEPRKASLQGAVSNAEPQRNAAQAAVIAERRHLVQQWEEEQKWTLSALLTRLVLDAISFANATTEELQAYEQEYFGLQTKAVFNLLQRQHSEAQDLFAFVFSISTVQVYEHFDTLFTQALAVLSSSVAPSSLGSRERGRQGLRTALTTALANLLFFYDSVSQNHQTGPLQAWQQEQRQALKKRIQDQFSSDLDEKNSSADNDTVTTSSEGNETSWWSQLLLHGHWSDDNRLVKWYLGFGYANITSPRVLEAFAAAHWESKKPLCVELILLSPFSKLHAHHRDRLLQSARTSGSRRIFELLLLRFDVQTLLHAGLYHDLLSLHLSDDGGDEGSLYKTNELLGWTSSGEYLVCVLVMLKDFATAARLTCALWHVHPLLWDFENARLTLANYLKRLATTQLSGGEPDREQAAYEEAVLRHEVYSRTFTFFQRSMAM